MRKMMKIVSEKEGWEVASLAPRQGGEGSRVRGEMR
jgi:hypothetical protein